MIYSDTGNHCKSVRSSSDLQQLWSMPYNLYVANMWLIMMSILTIPSFKECSRVHSVPVCNLPLGFGCLFLFSSLFCVFFSICLFVSLLICMFLCHSVTVQFNLSAVCLTYCVFVRLFEPGIVWWCIYPPLSLPPCLTQKLTDNPSSHSSGFPKQSSLRFLMST